LPKTKTNEQSKPINKTEGAAAKEDSVRLAGKVHSSPVKQGTKKPVKENESPRSEHESPTSASQPPNAVDSSSSCFSSSDSSSSQSDSSQAVSMIVHAPVIRS
jgi:hypothetical protein